MTIETYIIDGKVQEEDLAAIRWNQIVQATAPTCRMYRRDDTYFARLYEKSAVKLKSGDDWLELINDIIDKLYQSGEGPGGKIELRPSAFTMKDTYETVDMRPGIWVVGESSGPGHLAGGLAGKWPLGTTIETGSLDATPFTFDFPTPLTAHYMTGLANLFIAGPEYDYPGTSTKPLIDMQCNNNYLSDIFLNKVFGLYGKYGLRIRNNAASTFKIWNIYSVECMFEDNTYSGIIIESPTNQVIERVRILANHFYGNCIDGGNAAIEISGHETHGCFIGAGTTFELENRGFIYMADETDLNVLNGVIAKDGGEAADNTYSGIKLVDVDLITLNGVHSVNRANSKMKYGYEADNDCTYLVVMGNIFKGQTAGAVFGTGTGNIGDATTNAVVTG